MAVLLAHSKTYRVGPFDIVIHRGLSRARKHLNAWFKATGQAPLKPRSWLADWKASFEVRRRQV